MACGNRSSFLSGNHSISLYLQAPGPRDIGKIWGRLQRHVPWTHELSHSAEQAAASLNASWTSGLRTHCPSQALMEDIIINDKGMRCLCVRAESIPLLWYHTQESPRAGSQKFLEKALLVFADCCLLPTSPHHRHHPSLIQSSCLTPRLCSLVQPAHSGSFSFSKRFPSPSHLKA